MTVRDIMEAYEGEVRIVNKFNQESVCVISTAYKDWLDAEYMDVPVEQLMIEVINTSVISARLIIFITEEVEDENPVEPEVEEIAPEETTEGN